MRLRGVVARRPDKICVRREVGKLKRWKSGLRRAENVAGAAKPKVFLGDFEAVFGVAKDFETRCRGFA